MMRLALSGVCLVVLTACGGGFPNLTKKSSGGSDEPVPAVASEDAEPVCVVEGADEDDSSVPSAKIGKDKKEKPEQANRGRKKENEDGDDEQDVKEELDGPTESKCVEQPAPAPSPDSATLSYAQDVEPIMAGSCVSCHSASRADGGIALDTLASVQSSIDATIASIESGRMPIGNATPVSETELDALRQWKAAGFPE